MKNAETTSGSSSKSRRSFLQRFSLGMGAAVAAPGLSLMTQSCRVNDDTIVIPRRQVGIALVGLGQYSTEQLGPALLETQYCRMAGVVSNYDNFDNIRDNPDIDVIYLVLPPVLHPEFAIRAFDAGKHVICEKPMAPSEAEAREMLAARDRNRRLMSIGYRLHFEPHNREVMRLGQQRVYGPLEETEHAFKTFVDDPENWRARRELGGGSVWDVGIYTIQAAIYTIGALPLAVTATQPPDVRPDIFGDVDERMEFTLEFPGGVTAECACGFHTEEDLLKAKAQNGYFKLEPAQYYSGIRGETSDRVIHYRQVNQQAKQMDDFALRVLGNRADTPVPGEMGLRDVIIIEAVYESARRGGERVEINLNGIDIIGGEYPPLVQLIPV
jgi:predicted dehydrogenase